MTAGAAAAVALEGVRVVRGGREVLHVERLAVHPGETLALLGPNGAGKSTLLQAAALLLPVREGRVSIFGEHAGRGGARVRLRRRTATVFQDSALLDMSVRANVETALGLHGVPRNARREAAEAWLARLGVAHLAGTRGHQLSGGEAQRVSLARAFAVRPDVLFLDEPFASLDLETRSRLVGELRALLAEEQTTTLLATHDHAEARLLAGRTAVILEGRVAQVAPTAEVFRAPASPQVAAFLGWSVGADPFASGEGPAVAIDPSGVRLVDGDEAAFEGRVQAVMGAASGARVAVEIALAGGREASVIVPVDLEEVGRRGLQVGSPVRVRIDPGAVRRFA